MRAGTYFFFNCKLRLNLKPFLSLKHKVITICLVLSPSADFTLLVCLHLFFSLKHKVNEKKNPHSTLNLLFHSSPACKKDSILRPFHYCPVTYFFFTEVKQVSWGLNCDSPLWAVPSLDGTSCSVIVRVSLRKWLWELFFYCNQGKGKLLM